MPSTRHIYNIKPKKTKPVPITINDEVKDIGIAVVRADVQSNIIAEDVQKIVETKSEVKKEEKKEVKKEVKKPSAKSVKKPK